VIANGFPDIVGPAVSDKPVVAVIGGGPAGLMAAEVLAAAGGVSVHLFDAMPSVGRKFLMAGKGGLNLTHSEPFERLLDRYGPQRDRLAPILSAFTPQDLRDWAKGLGIETFIGSSGRVFPTDFKAAPLLRTWLRDLRAKGVRFHLRHRWQGWSERGDLVFATPSAVTEFSADAVVLALGGASWPQLGSDGAWTSILATSGIALAPWRPANCGFDVGWSEYFRTRFAGTPLKSVAASAGGVSRQGEFVITETGIEGSLIYALGAGLRDAIDSTGNAVLTLDLLPDKDANAVANAVAQPRGSRSLSTQLKRSLGLPSVKVALLRECLAREAADDPALLARSIKALPVTLRATRPIAEAISSAGGVAFAALTEGLMLRARPGVFCAGEMLDWETITGGYLLTACFALGRHAGRGAAQWLRQGRGVL
jgi:uncharacterized flavoprotein (TIGR03862 family)